MTYRVVLWTTGHVARFAGRAIVDHPDMELVGAYAWSPEKVGKDVGEICGLEPLGVVATDDVDALVALSVVLVQPRAGAGNAKRFADAESFARRAIQLQPKNAVAWDRLGVA